MEWQHYTRIKVSMSHIEGLLKDMEDCMYGKRQIYSSILNDLTKEELAKVKDEIRQIKSLLKQTKKEFDLKHDELTLSQMIRADCSSIWETIEDLWSHKVEKSYGKISSKEKKEKLDAILKQIHEHNERIQRIIGK